MGTIVTDQINNNGVQKMENDRRTPAYLVVGHRSKMVDDAWFAANFWVTIVIISWEVKRKKLWSLVKFENHRGEHNTIWIRVHFFIYIRLC
jgi:hypothetical protein